MIYPPSFSRVKIQNEEEFTCTLNRRHMPGDRHPPASKVLMHNKTKGCLWLGSMRDAHDRSFLKRENIRLVVNCTASHPFNCYVKEKGLDHFRVGVNDSEDDTEYEMMNRRLDGAISEIKRILDDGGSVLVHCYAGMQRAATVCASFISRCRGWDHLRSMEELKKKRPIVFRGKATFISVLKDRYPIQEKIHDKRKLLARYLVVYS